MVVTYRVPFSCYKDELYWRTKIAATGYVPSDRALILSVGFGLRFFTRIGVRSSVFTLMSRVALGLHHFHYSGLAAENLPLWL